MLGEEYISSTAFASCTATALTMMATTRMTMDRMLMMTFDSQACLLLRLLRVVQSQRGRNAPTHHRGVKSHPVVTTPGRSGFASVLHRIQDLASGQGIAHNDRA